MAIAYVPRDAPGLSADQDWTAFGQRGDVQRQRRAGRRARRRGLDRAPTRSGARSPTPHGAFGQLIHAAVDVGIARGALDDGSAFLRERARPWRESERRPGGGRSPAAAARRSARDPGARRRGAARRRRARDRRGRRRPGDSTRSRTPRLRLAAAKAFGGETALEVATAIFAFAGTSAADRRYGSTATGATRARTRCTTPRGRSTTTSGVTRSTGPRRRPGIRCCSRAGALVVQAAHGQVDRRARHAAGLVGGHERRHGRPSRRASSAAADGSARRGSPRTAPRSCPWPAARGSKASRIVDDSGIAWGRRPTTRMPCGASSADRLRVSASLAACAGPYPPASGMPVRASAAR